MKSVLLRTKLHRPSLPPQQVRRPQITQRLNEGLAAGRQLTLVSAPAGFGKSNTVIEWLDQLGYPAAWLSLDRADNDPVRFFTYLVAALQKVQSDLGQELESVLSIGQLPPPEVIAATLVNDMLLLKGKFLLILDDFQVIQEQAILSVLETVAANQPEPLHMVLVTREDPLLPLARLRANNQVTEIRAGDLRFSEAEAARFLNDALGLSLSRVDIERLESRTEGWIVGLQLAGLSMRGRSDPAEFIANLSGSHRYILSYLTEEVLNRQTAEIRNFLLHTAILDKLCGELCDALTGRVDSDRLLEQLLNANLFLIPLDDEQRWYRYHHLFADLLRNLLQRTNEDQITSLHQSASRWYEQAGMAREAVQHALAAEDYPLVVRLIENHTLELTLLGHVKTVESWMQAVPEVWRSQNPRANLAFAWMHLLRGSYGEIDPFLRQAEIAIEQSESSGIPASELRSELLTLQANLANVQGKPQESIQLARRALESINQENSYLSGSAYLALGGAYRLLGDYANLTGAYQKAIQHSRAAGSLLVEMMAFSALTMMAIQHGRLRYALELGSGAVEPYESSGRLPPPILATVYGVLGLIYFEWNRLEEARYQFLQSQRLSTLGGHNAGTAYSHILMARLYQAAGDPQAALKAEEQAIKLLPSGIPAWLRPEIAHQRVQLCIAQGDLPAAEAVLSETGKPDPEGGLPEELATLAHLRVMLFRAEENSRKDEIPAALDLAGRLITAARREQRDAVVVQALLLRARLQTILGNEDAGLDALREALKIAEPEGYLRTFVEEGAAIARLLGRVLENNPGAGYVHSILRSMDESTDEAAIKQGRIKENGESAPRETTNQVMGTGELIEPLTDRELEVLRLIARGLKYKEISEQLFVSLNTVRFHVKSIYGKLGVNNRTQAVETARHLDLL